MATTRAQQSDWPGLEALYRRNHPGHNHSLDRGGMRTQTFVMRHDGHRGRLQGFVQASYDGTENHRRGAIGVLEIESSLKSGRYSDLIYASAVRGLIRVCVAWLEAQRCTSADVTVLAQPDYDWVLPELGARSGPTGPAIPLVPRQPEWHQVLDGQTGLIHSVAGPEGRPPGPQPEPFKMPDRIWN